MSGVCKSFFQSMKITHLINEQAPRLGGAQKIIEAIVDGVPYESEVYAFDYIRRRNFVQKTSGLMLVLRLSFLFIFDRKDRLFVVHHRLFLLLVILFRPNALFVCHSTFPNKKFIFKLLGNIKVVAVSEAVKEYLMSVNSNLDVEVIENGVGFCQSECRVISDSKDIRIGFVGRPDHVKGYDVLLEAIMLLKHKDYFSCLSVVHVGPTDLVCESAKEYENSEELKSKISHLGYIEAPFSELKKVSFICVPSRFEGFGLVIHEAYSRGHIIVASALDVFPWRDEKGVFYFEPGCPQSLAKVIDSVIASEVFSIEPIVRRRNVLPVGTMQDEYRSVFECVFISRFRG